MAQIIVPFIIGAVLLVIFFIPQIQITETYIWIGLALIITISAILVSKMDAVYFDEEIKETTLSWPLIGIAVFLFFTLRVVFNNEILMNW
jgi:phosphatidylserine synthase